MRDDPITLRDLLHASARWYPEHEAVADGTIRYRYAGLADRVRRMATLLYRCGVRKGDRVALLCYPSAAHLVALFGAFELGAVPCALHLRESVATLAAVLERLGARALVYDGALAETAAALRRRVPLVSAAVRAVSEATPPAAQSGGGDPVIPADLDACEPLDDPVPLRGDDLAVIALSSGTTGLPKGIMHTHRTQYESARTGVPMVGAGPASAVVNVTSTAFIGWYNCTLPFIAAAGKVCYLAQWDPRRFLERLQAERATFAFLVPTMWRMLLGEDVDDFDLSALDRIACAGEPMDAATLARVRTRICPRVLNVYGATETGAWAGGTALLIDSDAAMARGASAGKPLPGSDIRVVRPGGGIEDVVPAGVEGEVLIRGPSVARDIWHQPDVARRVFDGPWWRSGDLGLLDEEGFLYLRGRVDDMIISGGINVLPAEIEAVLLAHPAVAECAVVGLEDPRWGQRIVAFVVARDAVSAADLQVHVRASDLAAYKHPREYRFVDGLPRGNTGKIARRALRT